MAAILRKAVDHADNFRPENDKTLWQFRVFDVPYTVGLIRDVFMTANFPAAFKVDKANRIVTLNPDLKGRTHVQAADEAFIEFCEKNTALCKGFAPWLAKSPDKRDWHAIFGLDAPLTGLRIATPSRSLFGVGTCGVHCNVYSTAIVNGKEVIDTIWLSKRSARATFPLAFDNLCGSAMEIADQMDAMLAFKRELQEEAGLVVAADNKTIAFQGKKCGEIRGGIKTISIATLKGPIAGPKEDGHLEFVLRYTMDIQLLPNFSPVPNASDADVGSFHPIKVSNFAKDLFDREWKYSSGAVMIDFILRHDLMPVSQAEKKELLARLHYRIPFKNVQKYLE
ncbi:hypothetical protein LIA77_01631 [Sarocladium implicatum]|nr:hypothetical protein LIA77_01631 [Sarocladium implicatum]